MRKTSRVLILLALSAASFLMAKPSYATSCTCQPVNLKVYGGDYNAAVLECLKLTGSKGHVEDCRE